VVAGRERSVRSHPCTDQPTLSPSLGAVALGVCAVSLKGVGPQIQFVLWSGNVARSHIAGLWSTLFLDHQSLLHSLWAEPRHKIEKYLRHASALTAVNRTIDEQM